MKPVRPYRPPYARTRSRSSIVQVPYIREQALFGGTTAYLSHNNGVVGVREVMDDIVVPGFKEQVAAGSVINNACMRMQEEFGTVGNGYRHTYVGPPPYVLPTNQNSVVTDKFSNLLTWKLGQPVSRFNESGRFTALELINDDDVGRLVTLTATKALSNYNKSYAQTLVFLGELGEALHTLRNPLAALTKYLQKPWRYTKTKKLLGGGKVKTTRIIDPVSEIIPLGDAAANQYLSWYYGLKPIMKDVEDAQEACEKLLKVRRRTSAEDSIVRNSSVDATLHKGGVLLDCKYTRKTEESVKVTCGLLFQPQVMTAGRAFGVSLNAVPSAVFELIPWSFTTSWVSNLGTWVNALSVMYSSDIRAEWCVVEKSVTVNRFCIPASFSVRSDHVASNFSDGDWYRIKDYTRFPINLASRAGIVLKKPNLAFPTTIAAASLAIQQLVGKSHKLLKG